MTNQPNDPIPPFDRRGPARAPNLEVVLFQIGALQTALDRGLGGLEKVVEKGFDSLDTRVGKLDDRMAQIERRQEFDAARLKSLEQFREEQDRRDEERRRSTDEELKLAVDSTAQAKMLRWTFAAIAAVLGVAGGVVALINALANGS